MHNANWVSDSSFPFSSSFAIFGIFQKIKILVVLRPSDLGWIMTMETIPISKASDRMCIIFSEKRQYSHRGFEWSIVCLIADDAFDAGDNDDDLDGLQMGLEGVFLITK